MRPHVCIPSGCQQWTSKAIAVGVDKFAYMSSLAVYVYSSYNFLPLAILAKHPENLTALAMSPFDSNLLACTVGTQEIRVYDVDTEMPVCRTRFTAKSKSVLMEWHRTTSTVILLALGPHLEAWDFGGATGEAGGGPAPPTAAPPQAPPSSQAPRSVLTRLRAHARGGGGGGGGAADDPTAPAPPPSSGKWVTLRDVGAQIMAIDQISPAVTSGGGTMVAVATSEGRVVLMELDPSGLAVRYELRSIMLPDVGAASGVCGGAPGIGPASAVRWEPLSGNGLLLAVGRAGSMALYDTTSGSTVSQYAKQPATATRYAAFLPTQPGNFLVSSSRSGVLQLWNVSQPQPLRLFKLGGGLVQSFVLLPSAPAAAGGPPGAEGGAGSQRTAVLVSFADGALCVYDVESQRVLWRQEGGHTETAFDCRFCTTDPNLFATASFDSSIRVWDVRTARCVRHLVGAEGILYSVSWSADGKLLAASNDSGVIFLYDYARGALLKSMKQHTKQSLRVAFHPTKPSLLASASIDGTVMVYTTDGEIVRGLRHTSAVSGLAWGLLTPSLLATTSEGGELFVWDVARPPQECLVRMLSKHSSRSFNVEFSPLLRNHLLSSSNDHTARVWDVSTGDCVAVLQGHVAQVRAVAWHPEVAHICFTGSWDATVRVWDVRTARCLHVSNDHIADVYGIACHPRRPFFLVTCSRDSTLRLWSTLDLTPSLMPQALVRPLSQLRLPAKDALALLPGAPPALSGEASREVAERLACPAVTPLDRFAAIAELFLPPACVDVFWDLARCVRTTATSTAPGGPADDIASSGGPGLLLGRQRPTGSEGALDQGSGSEDCYSLHHWTAARMAVSSAANHLELAACSKARPGGSAAGSSASSRRADLVRAAAQQHLVAGDVEHCCQLLVGVGDWDRALALAPVVGLGFWQKLMRQRVEALAAEEDKGHVSDVLPLYLVSGHVPALVEMLSTSCMYDTAFNVAAVQASGGYKNLSAGTEATANGTAPPLDKQLGYGVGAGSDATTPAEPPPSSTPVLLPPSSSGFGARPTSPTSAALPPPSGLERVRSAGAPDITSGATPLTSPMAYGCPLPLPPFAASLTASVSLTASASLPPVTLRGGSLPSIARTPSLRPPPLAAIQTASSAPVSPPPVGPRLDTAAVADSQHANGTTPSNGPSELPSPGPLTVPASPRLGTPVGGGRAAVSSARQRRGGGAGEATSTGPSGTLPADCEAFARAVAVRCSQARSFLAQGLPLHAASCALSVDDLAGAVGLLLRGGCEELALALVAAMSRPVPSLVQQEQYGGEAAEGALLGFGVGLGAAAAAACVSVGDGGAALEAVAAALRPRVLVAAAQRREASGDFLSAAELMAQVPGRSDLKDLLAGRCRAQADRPTATRVFGALGLPEPANSGPQEPQQEEPQPQPPPAADVSDSAQPGAVWESVRRLLLAGQHEVAAERALAGVRRLVETGERVSLASPEWEQAWTALNSLHPPSLSPATWTRVFPLAAYVGALLALEQGCAAVGLHLVRVVEAWAPGRADCEPPVSAARLAAEVSEGLDACLALPAYGSPGEVRQALTELLAAPQGSPWMQGMLQARLAAAEEPLRLNSPSRTRPSHLPTNGTGPGTSPGNPDGDASLSSPSSSLARRMGPLASSAPSLPSAPTIAQAGGAAAAAPSGGASLRLGAQEILGGGTGRLTVGSGGALAASLSTLAGAGGASGRDGAASAASAASGGGLVELSQGPVVVAAAHVPSRSSGSTVAVGATQTSAVSGTVIRGAAVTLDDGRTRVTLSEAVALRRVMSYSPLGNGTMLHLP